jgi:hypothetical protein
MKKPKLLLSFAMIFAMVILSAQEENQPKKRIYLNEFYSHFSLTKYDFKYGSASDFKTLTSSSELLKDKDLSSYSNSNFFVRNYKPEKAFSVLLGFNFSNKYKTELKTNPTVRIGVSYFSASVISASFNNDYRVSIDTIYSPSTGNTFFVDSTYNENYSLNYNTEQIRLDASVLFRTSQENRVSLFAGIGVISGISFNAYTDIYYYKNSSVETVMPNFNSGQTNVFFHDSSKGKSETIIHKSNYSLVPYIPMGIDFRLGKRNKLLKHTHLFYELRAALDITTIPELRTTKNGSILHGVGVRVTW